MKEGITGSAEFTLDGRCRLSLKRLWNETTGLVFYIGLNPSKADAYVDDMTVVKGMGFAKRWGFGGTMHGNAFPYISTNPGDLVRCTREEIELNDKRLLEMANDASLVVLAWGAYPKRKNRFDQVAVLMRPFRPVCVGRTKDGFPKHISRIGYDSEREPWWIEEVSQNVNSMK